MMKNTLPKSKNCLPIKFGKFQAKNHHIITALLLPLPH